MWARMRRAACSVAKITGSGAETLLRNLSWPSLCPQALSSPIPSQRQTNNFLPAATLPTRHRHTLLHRCQKANDVELGAAMKVLLEHSDKPDVLAFYPLIEFEAFMKNSAPMPRRPLCQFISPVHAACIMNGETQKARPTGKSNEGLLESEAKFSLRCCHRWNSRRPPEGPDVYYYY